MGTVFKMIRTRTTEGSGRRLRTALAGGVLLAGLLARPATGGPGPTAATWDVRLTVAVKGTYALKGEGRSAMGEYVCRALFEGRLLPDGDDFLLVHGRTEALEWSLRERGGQAGAPGAFEIAGPPPPVLRLNYVLRDKKVIEIDFEFEGVTVSLPPFGLDVPLELPRSARPAGAKPGYDDLVLSGSNRVVLPVGDLQQRRPERTFAWSWRRHEQRQDGGRVFLETQDHSVEAVVALVRR